jgi:hypothetical protein
MVDKDINVRSKDEPKLSEIPTSKCHYEPKDEPQYDADEVAKDINRRVEMVKKEWSARHIEDEPQTDGILFKGNLKESDYKLIKTTNGWVLEGNDIAYYGEPQTDCFKAGKWYSFSDYVVEMQGEVKPTAFRIMPLEHYTNQTERSE